MINAFILDCKKEVQLFIAETIDIDLPVMYAPAILETIVDILNYDDLSAWLGKMSICYAAECYLENRSNETFNQLVTEDAQDRLTSAMMKLAGAIRNKLRSHHAYVDGQFPFTFHSLSPHGTLHLTRKREAAGTIAHHPRHTGDGGRAA